jgi:hypothetical protein
LSHSNHLLKKRGLQKVVITWRDMKIILSRMMWKNVWHGALDEVDALHVKRRGSPDDLDSLHVERIL